jgi:hypothetical protein
MSYTTKQRNDAVLVIGEGHPDFTNVSLYEGLEKFNWIKILRLNGNMNKVELTYSGKDLFKRLLKEKEAVGI